MYSVFIHNCVYLYILYPAILLDQITSLQMTRAPNQQLSCCTALLEPLVTEHHSCDIPAGEQSTGPWDTFCTTSMKHYRNISTSKCIFFEKKFK